MKRFHWILVFSGLTFFPPTVQGDSAHAIIEFRRAETSPGKGLTEATVAGTVKKVYLHKHSFLTEKDIADTRVVDEKGSFCVEIKLSKEGQQKAAKLWPGHRDKPLAILLDGKVILAPTLLGPLPEKSRLRAWETKEEAERIAKKLRRR